MRRIGVWIAGGLLLAAALAWTAMELRPASRNGSPRFVHVERGVAFSALATRLEHDGLVRNARILSLYARVTGGARGVKAGRYRLSPTSSGAAILRTLVSGETHPVRIVFPEGIWMTEVAALLADSLGLDEPAVVAAARDGILLARFDIEAQDAEGYLFPDTYEFEGAERPADAIGKLLATARSRWTPERAARAAELGMTRHEILTLASIVEAETARADERRKVSAVYHRRLRRGMPLQADPTIVYAIGTRGRAPRYADLELSSPYNTYRRKGLPAGPIGSPGDASIDAALYPDSACTALFFVARNDGSHIFTDTFDEHVAARKGLRR